MLEKKSGFHYIFLKKPTGCPADHVLAGREHSTGLLSAASVPAKLRMPDGRGGDLGAQRQTGLGSPLVSATRRLSEGQVPSPLGAWPVCRPGGSGDLAWQTPREEGRARALPSPLRRVCLGPGQVPHSQARLESCCAGGSQPSGAGTGEP